MYYFYRVQVQSKLCVGVKCICCASVIKYLDSSLPPPFQVDADCCNSWERMIDVYHFDQLVRMVTFVLDDVLLGYMCF